MNREQAMTWCAQHQATVRFRLDTVIVEVYTTPNHYESFRDSSLERAVQRAARVKTWTT